MSEKKLVLSEALRDRLSEYVLASTVLERAGIKVRDWDNERNLVEVETKDGLFWVEMS